MYNRYVPQGNVYARVAEDEPQEQPARKPDTGPAQPERNGQPAPDLEEDRGRTGAGPQASAPHSGGLFPGGGLLNGLGLGKLGELLDRDKSVNSGSGLNGLLGALGLEGIDTGDILLLLIILLLLSEGDNLELVITLGLMLLLGLSDKKERSPDGAGPSGQKK